jgi:hypothetical protein
MSSIMSSRLCEREYHDLHSVQDLVLVDMIQRQGAWPWLVPWDSSVFGRFEKGHPR